MSDVEEDITSLAKRPDEKAHEEVPNTDEDDNVGHKNEISNVIVETENHRPRTARRRSKTKNVVKFFAGASCRYSVVREAARKMGWKLVEEDASEKMKSSCNLIWVDTSTKINEYFATIQPWQRINHFPGMANIARKTKLAEHLDGMKKRFQKDYSFYPTTYTLPRDKHHLKKYFEPSGTSKTTYIIKPDGGCQGRGIFLTKKWSDIDQLSGTYVAQKYIIDPLLIDNKKFDLRIYVLITSCDPLRIYLFEDGLVRLCTQDFSKPRLSNLENTCMHLSNYSINKRSEDFNGAEDVYGSSGSKRSVKWFLSWLEKEKGQDEAAKLWSKIGHICVKTILSIEPILVREYNTIFCLYSDHALDQTKQEAIVQNINGGTEVKQEEDRSKVQGSCEERTKIDTRYKNKSCKESIAGSRAFAVLGFDVMVDARLKPHLIEVNHLPSFATDSPLDESIKSKVIFQALSVIQATASDRHSYEKDAKKKRQNRLFIRPSHKANIADKKVTSQNDSCYKLASNEELSQAKKIDNVNNIEEFVTEIYSTHAPEKIDKVDVLLRKYRGHEEWLIKKLKEKYCSDNKRENNLEKYATEGNRKASHRLSSLGKSGSNVDGHEFKVESSDADTNESSSSEIEGREENFKEVDKNLLFEDEILVQRGDYRRIYPPSKGKYKSPSYEKMRKHAIGEDFKREMRLICPMWQIRKYERHDENSALEEVTKEVPKPHHQKPNGYYTRGDWMVHGNIHKKSEPIPTKTIPLPSPKQLEAAERLTRGFSVENAVLISEDEAAKIESDDFVTRLSLAEKVGREIRKKNEEKFIPRSQLNMNPINIAFCDMLQNAKASSCSSVTGERCYVDFTGRKLG